jgi:hypothetical protein
MMLNHELVSATRNRIPRSRASLTQITTRDALATAAMQQDNRDAAAYADTSSTYTKETLQDRIGIVNHATSGPFDEAVSSGDTGKFERIVTGGTAVVLLLVYVVSAVTLYHWASPSF